MSKKENAFGKDTPWKALSALLGLFLLGLIVRLYRLDSVPLGAHGDVAWIGVNALDWIRGGVWPYYVWELYAPEPVIVYLAGISFALLGEVSFFASRLPGVISSTLVVPLGFLTVLWLNQNEFRSGDRLVRRTAWLFALAYAVSFYPIALSKTGQRSQVFPFFVIALTLFFAHAWETGKWWSFIAYAVVMALANYTYIPARLMPIMLIVWAIHQFFADRERFKARFLQFAVMGLLSALLVLPQLITYLRTPEAFFARASQSAGRFVIWSGLGFGGTLAAIGRKIGGEFAIFVVPWTEAYSEMGQPLLGIPLTIGFIIAAAFAFWRGKDKGLWWPMLGIPLMFLTDVLSGTQWQPHGLRMIGILPFIFILATRGFAEFWGWLEERTPTVSTEVWGSLLAALVVVLGAYQQWQYHFKFIPELKQDPATAVRLEAADQFLVDLVLEHSADGAPILITLDDFLRANIPYLLTDTYPERGSAFRPDGSLTIPHWDGPVLVVIPEEPYRPRHDGSLPEHDFRTWVMLVDGKQLLLPPLTLEAADYMNAWLADTEPVDTSADWIGQPMAHLYAADLGMDDFDTTISHVSVEVGGEVELYGYHVDSHTLAPGETLWLTLYWRATNGASEDYEVFTQLWDQNATDIAQDHRWTLSGIYRSRLWQPDELVPTRFPLAVPADTPPGAYTLIAGLYHVLENEPVPLLDADGNPVAIHVSIPGFRIALPPTELTKPASDEALVFGDSIELAGYAVEVTPDTVILRADWLTVVQPAADHTLFIHVTDSSNEIVAQLDTQPLNGTYPTTIWYEGDVVPDEYIIPLPPDLSPDEYALQIGWYTLPTGERLQATQSGKSVPDNRVLIMQFEH